MDVSIACNKITVTTLVGEGLNFVEFDVRRTLGTRAELVSISLAVPNTGPATMREVQKAATQAAIDLLQLTLTWPEAG